MSNRLTLAKVDELDKTYGRNHKQALKDCEKKLQKDPKNVVLQIWKANLLWKSPKQKDEAWDVCMGLCKREPPITDLEIVARIHEFAGLVLSRQNSSINSAGKEVQSMWQKAAKAAGKNQSNVFISMFQTSVKLDLWSDAQLAMLNLRNLNRDEPKYYFGYIAVSQLAADNVRDVDPKAAETDSKWAFAFLSKAVEQTLSNPSARNAVGSLNELRLVAQIYRKQGKRKELLSILDNKDIGITSKVGKNDPEFTKAKVELMEEEEMYADLYKFCYDILKAGLNAPDGSVETSDWSMWSHLMQSAAELPGKKDGKEVEELIQEYMAREPSQKERNIWMAYLSSSRIPKDAPRVDIERCKKYFDHFFELHCCFTDLRHLVISLELDERGSFVEYTISSTNAAPEPEDKADQLKWIMKKLNSLKFEYLLRAAKGDKQTLEAFVRKCLDLYKKRYELDVDASGPIAGDEAAVLAIMCLVKLHDLTTSKDVISAEKYYIQAAALCRPLIEKSPADRQVRLFAVKLYMLLGLGSMASEQYLFCRIKEIMQDTLSHTLFSRLSITHPFPSTTPASMRLEKPFRDSCTMLQQALTIYERSISKIRGFMGQALPTFQFDKALEFNDMIIRLSTSYTVRLLLVEFGRICRLRGQEQSALNYGSVDFDDWLSKLSDNRDDGITYDFEPPDLTPFASRIRNGPVPNAYWLAVSIDAEATFNLISTKNSPDPSLKAIKAVLTKATDDDKAGLTPAERFSAQGWSLLGLAARRFIEGAGAAGTDGKTAPADANQVLTDLDAWVAELKAAHEPKPDTEEPLITTSAALQTFFLHMDALRAVAKFADVAQSLLKQKGHELAGMVPRERVAQLSAAVKDAFELVRKRAKLGEDRLQEGGLGRLVEMVREGPTGEAIEGLVGAQKVEECAAEFRDSALDALEGVMMVKLS